MIKKNQKKKKQVTCVYKVKVAVFTMDCNIKNLTCFSV
jgi:hypothetical protein